MLARMQIEIQLCFAFYCSQTPLCIDPGTRGDLGNLCPRTKLQLYQDGREEGGVTFAEKTTVTSNARLHLSIFWRWNRRASFTYIEAPFHLNRITSEILKLYSLIYFIP